jgi:hypothetical protein
MESNIIQFRIPQPPAETSARYIAPPSEGPGVFTAHGGRPIWWRDEQDKLHACEGAQFHPGVLSYWTLCQIDVPAGEVFQPGSKEELTCAGCIAVIRARNARDETGAAAQGSTPLRH